MRTSFLNKSVTYKALSIQPSSHHQHVVRRCSVIRAAGGSCTGTSPVPHPVTAGRISPNYVALRITYPFRALAAGAIDLLSRRTSVTDQHHFTRINIQHSLADSPETSDYDYVVSDEPIVNLIKKEQDPPE